MAQFTATLILVLVASVGLGAQAIRNVPRISIDELKALMELCYSEQLADPERGVGAAAKRHMASKLLTLSEYLWQS